MDPLVAIFKTHKLVVKKGTNYQTEVKYILTIKRLMEVFKHQDLPDMTQIISPMTVTEADLKLTSLR